MRTERNKLEEGKHRERRKIMEQWGTKGNECTEGERGEQGETTAKEMGNDREHKGSNDKQGETGRMGKVTEPKKSEQVTGKRGSGKLPGTKAEQGDL